MDILFVTLLIITFFGVAEVITRIVTARSEAERTWMLGFVLGVAGTLVVFGLTAVVYFNWYA